MKSVTAATYVATADHFDDAALSFRGRFGQRTVDLAGLRLGDRILDACCGTGASALPAAQEVGADGWVLGLDLSEQALALARAKALAQGLGNVEFRVGDIEATGLASGSFDAVVCVFGIFFLSDMAAGVRELWRLVRPGGRLAVTVWGPRIFEPATAAFWDAVETERPDLVGGFHPWTRLTDPDQMVATFRQAGVKAPRVDAEAGIHRLRSAGDWWTIVLGTGYRATLEQLGSAAAERVRAANLRWLRDHEVGHVETNVVYGFATKGT